MVTDDMLTRMYWVAAPTLTVPSQWAVHGFLVDDHGKIVSNVVMAVVKLSAGGQYEKPEHIQQRALAMRDVLNRIYYLPPEATHVD